MQSNPHDAQNIACIGAGNIGRAWALVFAKAGKTVRLYDRDLAFVETSALPMIRKTLEMFELNQELTEPIDDILSRIEVSETLSDAVQTADYVQESIIEDTAAKRKIFSKIAAAAPPFAILASSTSAIMGSLFMGHIDNPERALVAHPVNPPSHIPLVEICGTPWTAQESIRRAELLLEGARMKPIIVKKEINGFILNRLQYTLVAEALHLVGEGYCTPEDIDRVLTDGLAMRWSFIGPFMVAHLNSNGGFKGFVQQLGTMMRDMGREAVTDYNWDDTLIDRIHGTLTRDIPVSDIPEKQIWRDNKILKARTLNADDEV